MIVEPGITRSQKYLAFKRRVGACALEYLVNLWGHCQEDKRGEFWGLVDADYVESVAGWRGGKGRLFEALTVALLPGKAPWLDVTPEGMRVHEWNERNAGLKAAWRNGSLGGRPVRPTDNPGVKQPDTRSEGTGLDGLDHSPPGAHFAEAEWPTLPEWLAYAAQVGLVEWKAAREHAYQESRHWRGVANWRGRCAYIRTLWEQDGRPLTPPTSRANQISGEKKGETSWAKVQRKTALEQILAEHPGNPKSNHSGEPSAAEEKDFREKNRELTALRNELATKGGT